MNIGIVCLPTLGGSGVVAAEIGLALSRRGHRVHFLARDLPVRLHGATEPYAFHEVGESDAPALARTNTFVVALASKIVEVATWERLDVLHVHYAVPHAAAAWMAREALGDRAPRLVTTLHGTDVSGVGDDPSHLPITRLSLLRSDAVTTPSAWLHRAAYENLDLPGECPIEIIPNFVDADRYTPTRDRTRLRAIFPDLTPEDRVLIHVSNFRPVKRVVDVVRVFRAVAGDAPCRLVLVGDGPDRSLVEREVRAHGLGERVACLGRQDHFAELLAAADVFLLPSESESFGLAALEALCCGVPVVASDVGGLPEVVRPGVTGFLAPPGDVGAFAAHVRRLFTDAALRDALARQAREDARARFRLDPAIDRYESVYERLIAAR